MIEYEGEGPEIYECEDKSFEALKFLFNNYDNSKINTCFWTYYHAKYHYKEALQSKNHPSSQCEIFISPVYRNSLVGDGLAYSVPVFQFENNIDERPFTKQEMLDDRNQYMSVKQLALSSYGQYRTLKDKYKKLKRVSENLEQANEHFANSKKKYACIEKKNGIDYLQFNREETAPNSLESPINVHLTNLAPESIVTFDDIFSSIQNAFWQIKKRNHPNDTNPSELLFQYITSSNLTAGNWNISSVENFSADDITNNKIIECPTSKVNELIPNIMINGYHHHIDLSTSADKVLDRFKIFYKFHFSDGDSISYLSVKNITLLEAYDPNITLDENGKAIKLCANAPHLLKKDGKVFGFKTGPREFYQDVHPALKFKNIFKPETTFLLVAKLELSEVTKNGKNHSLVLQIPITHQLR